MPLLSEPDLILNTKTFVFGWQQMYEINLNFKQYMHKNIKK